MTMARIGAASLAASASPPGVHRLPSALALFALCALFASRPAQAQGYVWNLPRGFPQPVVPADNPMTADKVALGRRLFYDKRLSIDGTYACASCHEQSRAFTDGRAHAIGATGEQHPRSAMSLANVAYATSLQWADPQLRTLEAQAAGPMFNEHPIEMGLKGREAEVVRALTADDAYRAAFARAFPGEADAVSIDNVQRAIASFERTLISGRSAFDHRVFDDDRTAMSPAALRGMEVFTRVGCGRCHSGINFSGPVAVAGREPPQPLFANTGLYNTDGKGRYPDTAPGLAAATKRESDHGRFRVPTLRNVAVTAPYMHDGSIASLEQVIDHYAAGGRQAPLGPAVRNRYRDPLIEPLRISQAEGADLIAFLDSLTDERFLSDPNLAPPKARDGWEVPKGH